MQKVCKAMKNSPKHPLKELTLVNEFIVGEKEETEFRVKKE
jgi:hypothetical protein